MGAVTISGLGSGLDIDSLVSGLVAASNGGLTAANAKVSSAQAAVSTLSGIGTLLSDLKSVVDSLDTATELASYSATASNDKAATVTSSGSARAGSYGVKVVALAQEQRTYGSGQSSANLGLNQTGSLRLTQGGTDYDINIAAGDSLNNIASKINELGAKMSASVFFDGTSYRLQVRSTETGAANAFTATENGGVSLGLSAPGANKQVAQDAQVEIDSFLVTSGTNTIQGAIEGVTLNLKETTDAAFTVTVKSNPDAMKTSLKGFVEKYNAVIGRIHSVAGYGGSKGTSTALKGDSSLRAITDALSRTVIAQAGTGGSLNSLADIGIRLNNDGTLKLDETKMGEALDKNPDGFAKVLAGTDTQSGVMDVMRDLLKGFTTVGNGILTVRTEGLNSQIKLFQAQADREQKRLDTMETQLRKQLNAMDASVSTWKNSMSLFTG